MNFWTEVLDKFRFMKKKKKLTSKYSDQGF